MNDFGFPWVHPYDLKALAPGRYRLECIYVLRRFWHDITVEIKL